MISRRRHISPFAGKTGTCYNLDNQAFYKKRELYQVIRNKAVLAMSRFVLLLQKIDQIILGLSSCFNGSLGIPKTIIKKSEEIVTDSEDASPQNSIINLGAYTPFPADGDKPKEVSCPPPSPRVSNTSSKTAKI